jgi:GntR family transcriptional regulator
VPGESVPLYRRIAEDLAAAIRGGEYDERRGLPSENELSRTYGVSRGTVRQAFAQLRASGVVSSRQGARRQAHGAPRLQSMTELLSFSRWARGIGEIPSSRVVVAELTGCPSGVAEVLELAEGTQVFHVVRVRLLGGHPVMLEDTYYPDRLTPLIRTLDLSEVSITDHLESHGVQFARAEHQIDAVAADAHVANLLGLMPGAPLLRTMRHTRDPAGEVVEHSVDLYRGESVAFVLQNSSSAVSTSRVSSTDASGVTGSA